MFCYIVVSAGGRADGRWEGPPNHFVPISKASHQSISNNRLDLKVVFPSHTTPKRLADDQEAPKELKRRPRHTQLHSQKHPTKAFHNISNDHLTTSPPLLAQLFKITENHQKSQKNHQVFHLRRPSYNLAATSRSTTLQNHRKSLKITKNTQKSLNFPWLRRAPSPFFLGTVVVRKRVTHYRDSKKGQIWYTN